MYTDKIKKMLRIKNRKRKKEDKRIPLQRYLTSRYLITLVIGLVVITAISAWWIRHSTLENRLNIMEFMAEEVANQLESTDESILENSDGSPLKLDDRGRFMDMDTNPIIYIIDEDGIILGSNMPLSPMENQINPLILENKKEVQLIDLSDQSKNVYVVKKSFQTENDYKGYVVFIESKSNLAKVNQEYQQLFIMISSLALLGWIAIYFLSKRLAKPIKLVARAARQVQKGNYNLQLPDEAQVEELHDLIHSFKNMSQQLHQLETLRTELLAGVTHELKTPVTSISGLIQAVNDDVVTGDEAKEFLQISLKETTKMKKMVEDLLDFNRFAAGGVPINNEVHSVNELIQDFVHQWNVTQQSQENIQLDVSLLREDENVSVDAIRVQQILTNLLNNAKHAMDLNGKTTIIVGKDEDVVTIDVSDNGEGIPEEEQAFIFERFFRGEKKKYKVGGLGLGLPFSKMIAQTLGGDLELRQSTPAGTTFRLTLPIDKN